jgi:hypothetical protein
MTTIVPLSVWSAYGLESRTFENGVLSDTGTGFGNDFVTLGTMRKVDAGARTFFGSGLGVLAV